uniref:Uncharacterized protein n=1 Tax=Strigamia maritima TaxID=126957 RepID=T1JIG4_STRMM
MSSSFIHEISSFKPEVKMGSCVSEPKTHIKDTSTNDVIARSSSLTIIPGDLENIGYVMHDVIVRNNLRHCADLLRMGFPINTQLKYSASVPTSTEINSYYEFCATALHVACIYRRPEIVELLLSHDANPNVVDRSGRTPVVLTVTYWPRVDKELAMTSIPMRSLRCLQCLCVNGADVNGRFGIEEETALHIAARYRIGSCVQVLIKFGGDVNAVDKKGEDVTCQFGFQLSIWF